jgi:CheY-like chemotaxis protein
MSLSFNLLDFTDKKIIVVEDDVPSVKYYETILRNTGADVNVLSNGKAFIDHCTATNEKPDLVLIDFLIPFVNGIECIRIFRDKWRDVPVLMVTAYYSENAKREAYIAGCNEYILKPVFPEKLISLLEKYLKPEIALTKSF